MRGGKRPRDSLGRILPRRYTYSYYIYHWRFNLHWSTIKIAKALAIRPELVRVMLWNLRNPDKHVHQAKAFTRRPKPRFNVCPIYAQPSVWWDKDYSIKSLDRALELADKEVPQTNRD